MALLTEAELIRTYQPPFNIALKDDKSPVYVHLTNETYPRVLQVRKSDIKHTAGLTLLGPYQSAYQLTQVLRLVRPIFKWCDQPLATEKKPCFYYHLDLCAGACIGAVSPEEYQAMITQLKLFLRGKTQQLSQQLTQEMRQAADEKRFEQAALYRDRLKAVRYISRVGKLKQDPIPLKLQQDIKQNQLMYLRRLLSLYLATPKEYLLERIEGYDVSNIQGKFAAVAQVVFTHGVPDKAEYRLYNIRTLDTPNDFGMLKEAITRRQTHPEWPTPNLVVIDGGKGQLRSVLSALKWQVPVIGIAKDPDRLLFPHIDTADGRLRITYDEVRLAVDHPALQLVAAIRDEAHRFSKAQQAKLHQKSLYLPPKK